jgi:hypothetical protein
LCSYWRKIYHFKKHCDIENGRPVGQFIGTSPATDDPEIRLNYRRPDTLTFFAKEAPFVASCAQNSRPPFLLVFEFASDDRLLLRIRLSGHAWFSAMSSETMAA